MCCRCGVVGVGVGAGAGTDASITEHNMLISRTSTGKRTKNEYLSGNFFQAWFFQLVFEMNAYVQTSLCFGIKNRSLLPKCEE